MLTRSTVKKLTMFSFLPKQALLSQLDTGFIAEPNDRNVLQSLWERANKFYNNLGLPERSFATSNDIHHLDGIDQSRIENELRIARTYSPYDSHTTKIHNVRISKLVTPQVTINLSRAEKRTKIRQGMNITDLFDIIFESTIQPVSITRQLLGLGSDGGSLLFTSYDEDIRLHHPPLYRKIPLNETDPHSHSHESVCLPIGGGIPFGAVYRIQLAPGINRLILANGIHRVYRLAKAGYEWCPLLVCDLIPFEIPDPFIDLPRDILLNPNSNPALITDFLNDEVVIPLEYYTLLKTIRLNWNFDEYFTVIK